MKRFFISLFVILIILFTSCSASDALQEDFYIAGHLYSWTGNIWTDLTKNYYSVIVKTNDEIVNNSTTLQNDDELFLLLSANSTYKIEFIPWNKGSQTADIKFQFNYPSGFSGYGWRWWILSNESATSFDTNEISYLNEWAVTTNPASYFYGLLIVNTGNISGNLTVQWAQYVKVSANTYMLSGSVLSALKIK